MKRSVLVLVVAVVIAGCNRTSATAPTPAPPTLYTITGTVSNAGGGGIGGAVVTVSDGPNAGQSTTTDVVGRYTLGGLTFATFTVTVSANGFNGVSLGRRHPQPVHGHLSDHGGREYRNCELDGRHLDRRRGALTAETL